MIVANIFDFIDGKVAHITGKQSAVRRVLGFDARSLFRSRAVHRPDLAVCRARPQRLRADRHAGADLLDHDQLRARPRRVADREVQGRLHGAAGAHRAVHDRRLHRSDGRRAVGDPGAVDHHRRNRIYYTYLALNNMPMPGRRCSRGSSSGATSARRCPTTSGSSPSSRSCGWCRRTGCAIRRPPGWDYWRFFASRFFGL